MNIVEIPKTRKERLEKLQEVSDILKKEFLGIDDIIDNICQSISPWYVTPEILERPVVVSLWGMTGTGKTSVVNRLVRLLGVSGITMSFDCGLEASESSSTDISEKIGDFIGSESYGSISSSYNSDYIEKMVFIFDEFQYSRTINEHGEELLKSPLRPIWTLMDSGKLTFNPYRFQLKRLLEFIEDLESFIQEGNYKMKVNNGEIEGEENIKKCLFSLGVFHYSDRRREANRLLKNNYTNEDSDDDLDFSSPLKILDDEYLTTFIKKLNECEKGLGFKKYKQLLETKYLGDFFEILKECMTLLTSLKEVSFSKSLIFILGNLDEAFKVEANLSPDMDADTFRDQTLKVSISDIKEALKKRFRAEQIARFGNNIIKYPTLSKDNFLNIIHKELDRVSNKFKEEEKISVKFDKSIVDLVYLEGVYPTQGVRPILTTIGSLITPLFSDIIINKLDGDLNVKIKVASDSNCKVDGSIKIDIYFEESKKIVSRLINLTLAPLRNPNRIYTKYINSVHEAGHAILYLYRTGNFPINIVSVSTDNGGFCNVYDKRKNGEIDTKYDIDSDVMISLAGYEAERLVFKDNVDLCLMGSQSDLENSWESFSEVVYTCGYFKPMYFSNFQTMCIGRNIPGGFSDEDKVTKSENLLDLARSRFEELRKDTKSILLTEKKLLKEVSLYLGKNGSMTGEIFEKFVKDYATISEDDINKIKENFSENWYLNKLMEFE